VSRRKTALRARAPCAGRRQAGASNFSHRLRISVRGSAGRR